jgi:hypothetical protein
MLYGIAVVVIAAAIFLIVYNIRAAKSSKPPAMAERAERITGTAQNKVAEGRSATAGNAAQSIESLGRQTAGSGPQATSYGEPHKPPQTDMGVARPNPGSPLNREQSDDEYRQALRSFSGLDTAAAETAKEQKEEGAAKESSDEAYREGLRSLVKRD